MRVHRSYKETGSLIIYPVRAGDIGRGGARRYCLTRKADTRNGGKGRAPGQKSEKKSKLKRASKGTVYIPR
jgi:hypothetical protein